MEIVVDGALPPIPEPLEDAPPSDIALAVDVGTTTVAVAAWQVCSRRVLSVAAEPNAQGRFGADVMARIGRAVSGGASPLADAICSQISRLASRALLAASPSVPRPFRPRAVRACVTGNTAMLSLAMRLPVDGLAALPFEPPSKFGIEVSWGEFFGGGGGVSSGVAVSGVAAKVPVEVPPIAGAFVGADAVCAMVAAGFSLDGAVPLLLADVGTNSELALLVPARGGSAPRVVCTACAAGPAFEAANVSCGMAGGSGAVDSVSFDGGRLVAHVIGGGAARGVCGSGLVSAAAAAVESRLLSADGEILGADFLEVAPGVRILQGDIRSLQLAKSAVRTGIDFLLGFSPSAPEFLLAGGFGSRLDAAAAAKVALFPPSLSPRPIGNAALFGASALLFSPSLRARAAALASASVCVNLAASPKFQENFIRNCALSE